MKRWLSFDQCQRLEELGFDRDCELATLCYVKSEPDLAPNWEGRFRYVREIKTYEEDVARGAIIVEEWAKYAEECRKHLEETVNCYRIGDLIEAIDKIAPSYVIKRSGVLFQFNKGGVISGVRFDNGEEIIDNLYDCLCWCLENLKGGKE